MINIRKSGPDEFIPITSLIIRSIQFSLKGHYPPEVIDEFCRRSSVEYFNKHLKDAVFYVALEDGVIIGVIAYKDNEIEKLFVDPLHYKKGVAKILFDKVFTILKKKGFKEIKVNSFKTSKSYYKKLGFKKVDTFIRNRANRSISISLMKKSI